jgi:hypothetical protein
MRRFEKGDGTVRDECTRRGLDAGTTAGRCGSRLAAAHRSSAFELESAPDRKRQEPRAGAG